MTPDNAAALDADDPPLFSAILTPHRSLGREGFYALMAAVAAINLIGAVVFFAVGAWPLLPFLGLDVALVFFAFRANYLAARAHEQVIVTATEIRVRKVDRRGRSNEWRFNPAWTRLTREIDPDEGVVTRLTLDEGRRRLALATLLPPIERGGFADALQEAMHHARRGPTRTVFGQP